MRFRARLAMFGKEFLISKLNWSPHRCASNVALKGAWIET